MSNWKCEICNTIFELKRDLIDDLVGHYDSGEHEMHEAEAELSFLVKDVDKAINGG